ncbi:MAG TPA: hypothetical protein VFK76_11360 [Gaiellaceae bacterium]|nr:hypothetical protein [Gaiellaceae bacterium]
MPSVPTNAEILADITGLTLKQLRRKQKNGEVIALSQEQAAVFTRVAERYRLLPKHLGENGLVAWRHGAGPVPNAPYDDLDETA